MSYAEKRDGKLTGRWYGEVVHKVRNREPVRFRRAFESKRAADGYEAYVKATGQEPPDTDGAKLMGPTFAQVAQMAREASDIWKRNRDPSGQKRLDYIIDRIGPLPIEQVTASELDKLVKGLIARPAKSGGGKLAPGTVNRYLTFASAVLRFATERDAPGTKQRMLPAMPTIPWQADKGKRIHWLSEDQQEVLCGYLVNEGKLSVALTVRVLCATGLRWGEFAGLEPHQVQGEWIKLDDTKTDTPRDVPIDEELGGELRAMLIRGDRVDYRTTRMEFMKAVKACGYPPQLTLHCLRHTTATILTKKGVPTRTVQEFLGHKSINTTLKYAHVEKQDLLNAAKNLYPQRGKQAQISDKGEVVAFKKAL